jgi:AcrR family transcriptional regulator
MYHHFATKLDLFRAVYEASERRAIGLVAKELAAAEDPFTALLLGARAYLRLAETNQDLRRIGLTQSRAVLGWSGWREAANDLGIGVVRAIVEGAIEAGQMSPRDADTTAQILLGAVIEAGMLIVVADDPGIARERSEAVIVELIEGLRSQP